MSGANSGRLNSARRRQKIEVGTGDLGDGRQPFHSHPFTAFHTPREVEHLLEGANVVAVRVGDVVCPWTLVDFARYVQFNTVPPAQQAEWLRIQAEEAAASSPAPTAPLSMPLPSLAVPPAADASHSPPEEFTVAVVSAVPGVGKTALVTQFVNRVFVDEYHPTCEERYRTSIDANRRVCIVNIVDTGAQEAFAEVTQANLAEKDGFLFVFSLDEPESLARLNDTVISLQEIYKRNASAGSTPSLPPIVLVANKKDADKHTVSIADAKAFRRQWRMEACVETSAKDYTSVELAFQILVQSMLNSRERNRRLQR